MSRPGPKQIHQTGGAGPVQTFPSANHHQRQQLPGQTAEAVAKYPDLSMVDYTLPLQIIQVIRRKSPGIFGMSAQANFPQVLRLFLSFWKNPLIFQMMALVNLHKVESLLPNSVLCHCYCFFGWNGHWAGYLAVAGLNLLAQISDRISPGSV